MPRSALPDGASARVDDLQAHPAARHVLAVDGAGDDHVPELEGAALVHRRPDHVETARYRGAQEVGGVGHTHHLPAAVAHRRPGDPDDRQLGVAGAEDGGRVALQPIADQRLVDAAEVDGVLEVAPVWSSHSPLRAHFEYESSPVCLRCGQRGSPWLIRVPSWPAEAVRQPIEQRVYSHGLYYTARHAIGTADTHQL